MALNPPITSIPSQENGQQGHIHRFLESIAPYQYRFATTRLGEFDPRVLAHAHQGQIGTGGQDSPQSLEEDREETESVKRRYDRKMRRRAKAAIVKPKVEGIKLGEALRETVRHSQESRKEAERQDELERGRGRKRKASEEGGGGGKRRKDGRAGTEDRTTHPQLFFSPSRRVTIPLDKALGRRLGIKESKAMMPPDLPASPDMSQDRSTVSGTRPNIQSHYFSLPPIPIDQKQDLVLRRKRAETQKDLDIHEFARQRNLPFIGIAGSASWPSAPSASSGPRSGRDWSGTAPRDTVPKPNSSQQGNITSQAYPAPTRLDRVLSSSSYRSSRMDRMPTIYDHSTHQVPLDEPRNQYWISDPIHQRKSRNVSLEFDRSWQPQQTERHKHWTDNGRSSATDALVDQSVHEGRLDGPYEAQYSPYAPTFPPQSSYVQRTGYTFSERPNTGTQPVEMDVPHVRSHHYHQDMRADRHIQYDEDDQYEPLPSTPLLPVPADTTQDIEYQLAEIQYQDHQAAIQPAQAEVHQHAPPDYGYETGSSEYMAGRYPWASESSRIVKENGENPFVAQHGNHDYSEYSGLRLVRGSTQEFWREGGLYWREHQNYEGHERGQGPDRGTGAFPYEGYG